MKNVKKMLEKEFEGEFHTKAEEKEVSKLEATKKDIQKQ